jgi:lipoprotein NlpI
MIRIILTLLLAVPLFAAEAPVAEPPPYEGFVIAAREAERKGLLGQAIEYLDKAIALDAKRIDAHFFKGRILTLKRKSVEAIAELDQVIAADPKASSAFQMRGIEQFKLGRIEKSIDDFTRYIQLEPQQEPYHWWRGISYYYAGKFEEGRKQFELHQTVNPNDVENGVWHFLCVARASGIEKARAAMLPISGDTRVPMSEVYALFAGKLTVDDVLKAAKRPALSEAQKKNTLFYAHLYIGLYYEAKGEEKEAYEHIKRAATEYPSDHYMGDVARVHFKRLIAAPAK